MPTVPEDSPETPEVTSARIEYYRDRQNENQRYNAEMAKWILASLILVNGGPFALLSKDLPTYQVALAEAVPFFSWGIALAILCGFLAWLNTGMRESLMGTEVQNLIARITDRNASQAVDVVRPKVVIVSYGLSVLAGFGSLIFFVWGALSLASSYQHEVLRQAASKAPVQIGGTTDANKRAYRLGD